MPFAAFKPGAQRMSTTIGASTPNVHGYQITVPAGAPASKEYSANITRRFLITDPDAADSKIDCPEPVN